MARPATRNARGGAFHTRQWRPTPLAHCPDAARRSARPRRLPGRLRLAAAPQHHSNPPQRRQRFSAERQPLGRLDHHRAHRRERPLPRRGALGFESAAAELVRRLFAARLKAHAVSDVRSLRLGPVDRHVARHRRALRREQPRLQPRRGPERGRAVAIPAVAGRRRLCGAHRARRRRARAAARVLGALRRPPRHRRLRGLRRRHLRGRPLRGRAGPLGRTRGCACAPPCATRSCATS